MKEINNIFEGYSITNDITNVFERGDEKSFAEADYLYRDNVEDASCRRLGVLFWSLRNKGYNDTGIAIIFGVTIEFVIDCCNMVMLEPFEFEKPRDLKELKKLLVKAYSAEYPEPMWLPEIEKEFVLAKVHINSVIKMTEHGVPTETIRKTVGTTDEEIRKALEYGLQDIYSRADVWR